MKFPVERARALLERLIPDGGSAPARKVHEAARRAGLPEWAIRKARKSLAIEVCFVGFGGGGWWEWRWKEPWTWTPKAADPTPPAPVCAWPSCGLPPRSGKAAYCSEHKQAALCRNKREWARKDRALLRRARKKLVSRVDRDQPDNSVVVGTPAPEPASGCLSGDDVGPEGVMIRLTPYYREQLVKRLRDYPGQEPGAVLERFMQLALDGSWLLTDREA